MASTTAPVLRLAIEGCGHGKLHDIYSSVTNSAKARGWDGVDMLIIGGDFQAMRNSNDLACMAVPDKYKTIGDFHEYYSGARVAPYLTVFVGGNHEASNYLFELYYGGWVAPNIYYLGAANVIRYGPFRIAGLSGIWKGYNYRKPHHERLPYSADDLRSVYHVREIDTRKLLQIRTQVDIGISHDWPQGIEWAGDFQELFKLKPLFEEDANTGRLGSPAAKYVLDRLRPAYWFSAHLHCKYTASMRHGAYVPATSVHQRKPMIRANQATNDPGTQRLHEPAANTAEDVTLPDAPSIKEDESKEPLEQPAGDDASKISAWRNFYTEAAEAERQEQETFMTEVNKYFKGVDEGTVRSGSNINYDVTWKKVGVKDDGLGREIQEVVKSSEITEHTEDIGRTGNTVKNEDEINLDSDDMSDKLCEDTANTSGGIRLDANQSSASVKDSEEKPAEAGSPIKAMQNEELVAEDVRNQLPASFTKKEEKQNPAPLIDTVLPVGITNSITNFTALDKCEKRRHFLHLTEIHPISDTDEADAQRPYELTYDKEWLAITRALVDGFKVGDKYAVVPQDDGDLGYESRIKEAAGWIEENVVKTGKLAIPHNFSLTAPIHDPSVTLVTDQLPPEYPNPQTAQFCELLGIENAFSMTEEQRQAQVEAIEKANSPEEVHKRRRQSRGNRNFHGTGNRGNRGGHRGNRGGNRGRGRGNRHRSGQ